MENKPQIFCFTYAGGSATFFDELERDLAGIDVVKLEYAGHGKRYKEAFYEDFPELTKDMFERVREQLTLNYALFGYSMGSISLVEVLREIIKEKLPLPRHIFLSAHEPHTKSELVDFTANELDEWVKRRTIDFGDVPVKLQNNEVFWRTYLPLYRADYSIISKYVFEELDLKTEIPATVFYSETDTPLTEMKLWGNYFMGNIDYYRYEGNHFFIHEHHREMAEVISTKMGVNHDI